MLHIIKGMRERIDRLGTDLSMVLRRSKQTLRLAEGTLGGQKPATPTPFTPPASDSEPAQVPKDAATENADNELLPASAPTPAVVETNAADDLQDQRSCSNNSGTNSRRLKHAVSFNESVCVGSQELEPIHFNDSLEPAAFARTFCTATAELERCQDKVQSEVASPPPGSSCLRRVSKQISTPKDTTPSINEELLEAAREDVAAEQPGLTTKSRMRRRWLASGERGATAMRARGVIKNKINSRIRLVRQGSSSNPVPALTHGDNILVQPVTPEDEAEVVSDDEVDLTRSSRINTAQFGLPVDSCDNLDESSPPQFSFGSVASWLRSPLLPVLDVAAEEQPMPAGDCSASRVWRSQGASGVAGEAATVSTLQVAPGSEEVSERVALPELGSCSRNAAMAILLAQCRRGYETPVGQRDPMLITPVATQVDRPAILEVFPDLSEDEAQRFKNYSLQRKM